MSSKDEVGTKGSKVFQNMTIHKQYLEYHELKNLMSRKI